MLSIAMLTRMALLDFIGRDELITYVFDISLNANKLGFGTR